MKKFFQNKKNNKDLLARICCVLFAIVMWIVVVSQANDIEQEMTFYAVPVTVSNANILLDEYGLSVVSEPDYITNITVRGSRAKFSKFSGEDLVATIDVKDIVEAGDHDIPVTVTCPPSSGFSVVSQSLESAKITVDRVSSKSFEIEVNILNAQYDAKQYALGKPTVSPSKVTVLGPQKLLDTISNACVNLDLGNVTSTIGFNRPILLLDSGGDEITSTYLSLSHIYADGEVPLISVDEASKITEKTVELTTDFKYGHYNKENCMVTVYPEEIKLKGSSNALSKLNKLNVFTIDETVHSTNTVLEVALTLPAGITSVDSIDTVTITINPSDEIASIELSMGTVTFKGMTFNSKAYLAKLLTLTFRGDPTLLDAFKNDANAFAVSVDLSKINDPGTYKLPCEITIKPEYNNIWCEFSYVYVTVE